MKAKRFGSVKFILGAAVLAAAVVLPRFVSNYYLSIFVEIALFAYLSSAWNILGGFAGQFSLGHALYVGLGAYTSTVLFNNWGISPWLGMLAGGLLATLVGILIGVPCFKLSGTFYTLASLALCTITMLLFQSTQKIGDIRIGGGTGLPVKAVPGNNFWLLQFRDKIYYYYVMLAFLAAILLLCRFIKRSKIGYQLAAVANDQNAAEALGVNSRNLKLKAMALSTFTAAMGGTLYAQYIMACSPAKLFGEPLSDEFVIISLIGGKGTILGPTIGACIIKPLAQLTTATFGASLPGLSLAIYGILLVVCIRFFPDGLYSLLIRLKNRLAEKAARRRSVGERAEVKK
ncbi:branched-chain amino acid ABC transporter permease [Feifania hominis]|uniref:Branched-chain amino acid ABC transporter permease n=1 Tax=Feifania hominis TaxID=2763660 RepID=A0A926DEJ9_9FIRM|nr:branched-chain amino acid ABC transporter permease [Feifania hominis]MBC8536397.1 branched-chain amino acid ABC transporter permease [Feifania hominis]